MQRLSSLKVFLVMILLVVVVRPAVGADTNTPDGITTPAEDTWPTRAVCTTCASRGGGHGEEKVAGASVFRGVTHYFCSEGCKAAFDTAPAGFLPPEFPRPAPGFTVTDDAAQPVTLAEYRGHVVLVDFWATWCKPCLAVIPNLKKLHSRYRDRGFVILGVSIDEKPEKAKAYAKGKKINYPVLYDTAESRAWDIFGVKAIPATFLIDRDGNIVAQWTGPPNHAAVENAIEALLEVTTEE